MASSDDEGETIPNNVSDYEFISGNDESVSFAKLPLEWNKNEPHNGKPQQIFLSGKTDNGLRKIYKQVTAWKYDLSYDKPEISVLSVEDYWIKLLKPRKPFQDVIRTIQITVHFLHFVKWNPQRSEKALWDHLNKALSMMERRPNADDLVDHLPLINEAAKRDGILANSKLLNTFLKEKPWKRKTSNEDVKPSFIVDDDNEDQEEIEKYEENGDDESDEDDCFDSVCAICDNGGHIYICEGKCMRSFHATVEDGDESNCESLGFTDSELEVMKNIPFYCKNCEHKQHQCFACGELGSSDESSVAEVLCCVNGACGHFYHPHCVAKLLHPESDAAAEEHGQRIAAGEQFACPAHKCHVCKEVEVRSAKELQFAVCRRCPRAYHRKCLPRGIAFEDDVDEERGIIQRAWEGLIPNRALIYCPDHEIDPAIATPVRDHIKFPGPQKRKKKELPLESGKRKDLSVERGLALEDNEGKRLSANPPKGANKISSSSKQGDLSRKRVDKLPVQLSSKKQKLATGGNSLGKLKEPKTDKGVTLGDRLYATNYGMGSEPEKSVREGSVAGGHEVTLKVQPAAKRINNSLSLDADARKRIFALMKDASSSITIDQIKRMHKSPSTHTQYSKYSADNITLGKVEGSVRALRAALKKLDEGGSVQDAKAVCGNDLLIQVLRWKDKLKVYLAPFLYGARYTSFGRHFTKPDKLKEIVDLLHWYVQDGDMVVDFCCGSNDFSCLMKKKLDEMGKSCLFKNYDILQAKNDFNFERRDWMGVRPNELLDGSKMIMGLNPPFGVNAALANKFINKALEFKPKLLILIVPRETQRLDEKESPYDLIWEYEQMFAGKSFYLPGSVDVNDQQIEDWNMNGPSLYLWSNPDWTAKHKAIAEQYGHLGDQRSYRLEESHNEARNARSSQECHDLDKSFVNQGEDTHPDKPENLEQEDRVTASSHQEDLPRDSSVTEKDRNRAKEKNHSEANSRKTRGKRKKNRQAENMFVEEKFSSKRYMSRNPSNHPSASPKETYSPKYLAAPALTYMHSERDGHQRNLSNLQLYSQTGYNRNQAMGDLVRNYGLNGEEPCQSMPSRQAYAPSPGHADYGFRGSAERWMGPPEGRANNIGYSTSCAEMNEGYERGAIIPSHVNVHGREELNYWSQRSIRPSYPEPPPYGQLNPLASSSYGGMNNRSAIQRYAPRLDELDHGRMVTLPPPMQDAGGFYPQYHHHRHPHPHPHPPLRPGFPMGPLGFAAGPSHPFPHHNSSGWLNE